MRHLCYTNSFRLLQLFRLKKFMLRGARRWPDLEPAILRWRHLVDHLLWWNLGTLAEVISYLQYLEPSTVHRRLARLVLLRGYGVPPGLTGQLHACFPARRELPSSAEEVDIDGSDIQHNGGDR